MIDLLYLSIFIVIVGIPWVWGCVDIVIMLKFKKEMGRKGDQTAIGINWIAFKWSWINYSHKIVEALPFFQKDLTETFGIRPDDHKIT